MNNLLFLIHYNNGDIMYYVNIFFLYSIIGFILEYIMYLINGYEGGILYGFWTPIYGIGAVVISLIYNKFIEKLHHHKILKFIIIFLTGFFLLTIIEFIGGNLIKLIFGETMWNYSDYEFNIGKFISLEMATIWGVSSLILIYLKDITDKIVKKIPKFISWILIILFIVDLICTFLFKT